MQAEAAKQIEALKEGLARELRKQKVCGWLGIALSTLVLPFVIPTQVRQLAVACCHAVSHISPQAAALCVVAQEVWVAAERAKREAWMAEQTRSIKESTIKGLEPEIQARRGRQWAGQRPNGMGSALAREQQG